MQHDITDGMLCGKQFPESGRISFADYWSVCGPWYEDRNITRESFKTFSFSRGLNKGDIMVLYGTKPKDIQVGDIIVFSSASGRPIIHRVVNTQDDPVLLQTKGDHNAEQITGQDGINELRITEQQYIGRAVFRIPLLGYVKIAAGRLWHAVVG
jgi:signal peptidase I